MLTRMRLAAAKILDSAANSLRPDTEPTRADLLDYFGALGVRVSSLRRLRDVRLTFYRLDLTELVVRDTAMRRARAADESEWEETGSPAARLKSLTEWYRVVRSSREELVRGLLGQAGLEAWRGLLADRARMGKVGEELGDD